MNKGTIKIIKCKCDSHVVLTGKKKCCYCKRPFTGEERIVREQRQTSRRCPTN